MRKAARKNTVGEGGFTLVELLVAMVVSSLIMAAIFCAFQVQHRTQIAQEQITDMEQNVRAALSVMAGEIRMAGWDPTGKGLKNNQKIVTAEPGFFTFATAGDQKNPVWITYCIAKDYTGDANQAKGVVMAGWKDWVENRPAVGRFEGKLGDAISPQPVARGVEAIEFVYLVGDNMTPKLRVTGGELNDIRAVTVSMLMRSASEDRAISRVAVPAPASAQLYGLNNGDWPLARNDNYRRKLHYTTVQLRNSGLKKPTI